MSLRVALLSPCFWPEVMRGGERITHELAEGLLERGHRPQLITSHPGPLQRTVEDGLPIVRLPRPPQKRLLRRMYEPYLTHVPLSYAVLRGGRYDLAHAVHTADALAASRWKRKTGRPALLSYMGIPDRPGLRERRKRLELMLSAVERCDAVVALSRHAGEAFRMWLGYDAPVIPPGVELRQFRPIGERSEHPTIICAAAAEEPRKHVKLLVDAFTLLRRELPDARLLLFAPRDFGAVRRLGVQVDAPGVQWRPVVEEREALARAYSEAWVAVLPAASETFGLVLVEALACGTPVVGYADAAIPEVIDRPEVGKLFDRLEARTLADALLDTVEQLTAWHRTALPRAGRGVLDRPVRRELSAALPRTRSVSGGGARLRRRCEMLERGLYGPPPDPKLSVVIPARDAAATLPETLSALAAQHDPPDFEVIVVDDGSRDATPEIAAASDVVTTVVRLDGRGPAEARNAGTAAARGERLAFLDADCRPAPEWLAGGSAALDSADLVIGETRPDPEQPIGPFDRTLSVVGRSPLFESANLFVRRELFEQLGGFEHWLGPRNGKELGEDVWFGWSAVRTGAKVADCPQALAYHAVFERSAFGFAAERWRLRFFPAMAGRMPELRATMFYRRYFLTERQARFDAALAGVALARITGYRALALAALPYAHQLSRDLREPFGAAKLVGRLLADGVGCAGLLVGSARYRTLVL